MCRSIDTLDMVKQEKKQQQQKTKTLSPFKLLFLNILNIFNNQLNTIRKSIKDRQTTRLKLISLPVQSIEKHDQCLCLCSGQQKFTSFKVLCFNKIFQNTWAQYSHDWASQLTHTSLIFVSSLNFCPLDPKLYSLYYWKSLLSYPWDVVVSGTGLVLTALKCYCSVIAILTK